MRELIAVTGATGEVGRRVVRLLAEAGARQRLVVRDPARADAPPGAEVRAVPGGYADGAAMRQALDGAHTVLLVPGAEAVDRVAQHRSAIDAAVAAGARRLVYLSFVDARPDSTFTLGHDHWATEEAVKATGLPWCLPRMNIFMDFLPAMAVDGIIRGPAGDGRLAAILRDDVAAALAAIVTGEGHDGTAPALTGPTAFTLTEAAAALTRHTGRPVRFEDETEEEAYASRAGYGASEWEVRAWVTSYLAIRDGSLAAVSGDIEALIGRRPTSLDEYLP